MTEVQLQVSYSMVGASWVTDKTKNNILMFINWIGILPGATPYALRHTTCCVSDARSRSLALGHLVTSDRRDLSFCNRRCSCCFNVDLLV